MTYSRCLLILYTALYTVCVCECTCVYPYSGNLFIKYEAKAFNCIIFQNRLNKRHIPILIVRSSACVYGRVCACCVYLHWDYRSRSAEKAHTGSFPIFYASLSFFFLATLFIFFLPPSYSALVKFFCTLVTLLVLHSSDRQTHMHSICSKAGFV